MSSTVLIELCYILSAALFIIGLKMMSTPDSARRGNLLSAAGMLLAVVITLTANKIVSIQWIIIGGITGTLIGALAARLVAMTQMPQMVAMFNGFGGIASLLVGWYAFYTMTGTLLFTQISIFLTVLIGGVTFTGSIVAFAKLAGVMGSKPVLFLGQKILNALLFTGIAGLSMYQVLNPQPTQYLFILIIVLSFLLGVLVVIPIGGADMPVVISLLNAYSGLAACAAGLVLTNNILIVAGALVGASGIILTNIMCKAMNRSLANVMFSGLGATRTDGGSSITGEVKPVTVPDAYLLLEAARSVVVVPGYGLAVAQAQHILKELGNLLQKNGCDVSYGIHPVAGRMPGHMNVLLAEANVPYDSLKEMGDVNPLMPAVDVAIVIGANDVVNPAARETPGCPIYGMPIINVDQARTVIVLKRSMAPGFAGVDNPLFFRENTRMLFGDAKESITGLVSEFKG